MKKVVVLVTGTSSGLGKVIAHKLELKKYRVYWGSREKIAHPRQIKLDVTSDSDCDEAVRKIIKKEGRIDVLVNNAGYSLAGPTTDFSSEDFLKILDTNSVGPFRLIKRVVPYMRKRKSGRIINITSLNGFAALPNFGLYSSSKFALEALGQALRYELVGSGIWITNVAPGAILDEKKDVSKLPHKSAREKFWFLKILLPMITKEAVAQNVIDIIKSPNPPPRVVLGNDAKIVFLLQRYLPDFLWDRLMFFVWNRS